MYTMKEVSLRLCLSVHRPQFGLTLYVQTQVQANTTNCNIVFYDWVYFMDDFIPIHKGGAEAIRRNCGKDATWLFENLHCISMISSLIRELHDCYCFTMVSSYSELSHWFPLHPVPDHFEGMLSMCTDGYILGVLEGGRMVWALSLSLLINLSSTQMNLQYHSPDIHMLVTSSMPPITNKKQPWSITGGFSHGVQVCGPVMPKPKSTIVQRKDNDNSEFCSIMLLVFQSYFGVYDEK